jgi:hypothetical protein
MDKTEIIRQFSMLLCERRNQGLKPYSLAPYLEQMPIVTVIAIITWLIMIAESGSAI